MKKYQIKTVADFLLVPKDRLADCLAEFAEFLNVARAIKEQCEIVAIDETFKWIDDGKKNAHFQIVFEREQPEVNQ
jgi:hypothetical protein